MYKRIAVAVVACVCVGSAFGAAEKIRWFDNLAEPNPDADGMAILNYVPGQDNIVAQVILSDLLVNDGTVFTRYVVALRVPGTWTLDTETDEVVLEPSTPGGLSFFFPMNPENLETDSKGHLTYHGQTTVGSGDFSDSDVFIFLQRDYDQRIVDGDGKLRIAVRMIGYNGTPAP